MVLQAFLNEEIRFDIFLRVQSSLLLSASRAGQRRFGLHKQCKSCSFSWVDSQLMVARGTV